MYNTVGILSFSIGRKCTIMPKEGGCSEKEEGPVCGHGGQDPYDAVSSALSENVPGYGLGDCGGVPQ